MANFDPTKHPATTDLISAHPATSREIELTKTAGESIARRGSVAKRAGSEALKIHSGMTAPQAALGNAMGHAINADTPGENPLDPNPLPKAPTPLTVSPGMRNRFNDPTGPQSSPGAAHANAKFDMDPHGRDAAARVIGEAVLSGSSKLPEKN